MGDDAAAREAIPLKATGRDPEALRARLGQWLAPKLGATRLTLSALETPGGTGVANETLMFEARWSGSGGERTQGFVARMASDDPLYIEADISVHHDMYEALASVPGVPVPQVYGFEPDPAVLGTPFFVMERMHGDVPGDQPPWPEVGFVVDASAAERRTMWENAVEVLAALHQVDTARFPFLGHHADHGGLAADLAYWRRYLDDASASRPHETLEVAYEWLVTNLPADAASGISWGDSRFANIMFAGTDVVSIFDWDTVSLAGAEADLAWWRFMDGPAAALPGIGDSDELVQLWEQLMGRKARHLEYYDTYTAFRLGAILLRLFGQLAASGAVPIEVADEQGRNSRAVEVLTEQLG